MALLAFSGAEESLLEATISGNVTIGTTTRTGVGCFKLTKSLTNAGLSNSVTLNFSEKSTLYFQGAIKTDNTRTAEDTDQVFLAWRNDANVLGSLAVPRNIDSISVYRGNKVTLLGTIGSGLGRSSYQLIEGKIVLHKTTGYIGIKLDGVLLFEYTGDTIPSTDITINNICFGTVVYSAAADWYTRWDDLIVCDDEGDYMNSWIGGGKIWCMTPTASGTYQEFTPMGEADNPSCVNQIPVSTEAYVESQANGLKDTYLLSTYPSTALRVAAVVARYWGAGEQQFKRIIRMNDVDYTGDTLTFPTTVGKVEEIFYVNLESGYVWRPTAFLDFESGMESVIPV